MFCSGNQSAGHDTVTLLAHRKCYFSRLRANFFLNARIGRRMTRTSVSRNPVFWSICDSVDQNTVVLISPQPDQEGNKLQRPNSNFCKPLKKKKNSEGSPSNQVYAAAVTSPSDEKWRPFNCFFSRVGRRTYQHPCTITGLASGFVSFESFPWISDTIPKSSPHLKLQAQSRNYRQRQQSLQPSTRVHQFSNHHKTSSKFQAPEV